MAQEYRCCKGVLEWSLGISLATYSRRLQSYKCSKLLESFHSFLSHVGQCRAASSPGFTRRFRKLH